MHGKVHIEQLLFDLEIERTAHKKLSKNKKKKQRAKELDLKDSFV